MYIKSSKTAKVVHVQSEFQGQTHCAREIGSRWVDVEAVQPDEHICSECAEAAPTLETVSSDQPQVSIANDNSQVVISFTSTNSNEIKAKIQAFETLFNRQPVVQCQGIWTRGYDGQKWIELTTDEVHGVDIWVTKIKRDYLVTTGGIELSLGSSTSWTLS